MVYCEVVILSTLPEKQGRFGLARSRRGAEDWGL